MNRIQIGQNPHAATIRKEIYSHFSEHLGRCIYNGIFVGKDSPIPNVNGMRSDVVEAMKRIHLPALRWPGGCFADEYHWRDGIGENRRRMVNTNWGGVVEDNSFGTHEFLELCRQVGCEPYINANVGSGTVREMAEWVEYLNSDGDSTTVRERWANGRKDPYNVRFWGVGNESWGCGGNMRPEFYADESRRYQTYCRNYGDNKLYRIACGPNTDDYRWTEVLMQNAASYMDGLSLHYYTIPKSWAEKGSATEFDYDTYLETLKKAYYMEELVTKHSAIMDRYDPARRVGLIVDEWGCWFDVEPGTNPGFLYQQNTMRDAMVAAMTLNIFNQHSERVHMANIAQTVNVLQAILLTEGDKLVLTPTYHVFDLYQPHMDAQLADCQLDSELLPNGIAQLSASASRKNGALTVTIANFDAQTDVQLRGFSAKTFDGRALIGEPTQHNTFDAPDTVCTQAFTDVTLTEDGANVTMPAHSILALTFRD